MERPVSVAAIGWRARPLVTHSPVDRIARRLPIAIAIVSAIAIGIAGCAGARTSGSSGSGASVPAIDQALEHFEPTLSATPLEAGQWAFELEMGGRGSDREALSREARRIAWVSFVLYRPGAMRVDSLVRTVVGIDSTGIDPARPIVYAGVKWVPRGIAAGDEYVLMTMRTDRGVVVRASPLFSTWTRGYDSTRLALSLKHTRDSIELHVRRLRDPGSDEFIAGAGPTRMTLRDSSGAIVWSASDESTGELPRPLMPDRMGDSVVIRAGFDGRDARTGERLPPGRYTLTGEVSARPRPYFIHEEISWGGR